MTDAPRPALAGIRVLDMTQFLSGPYCTQILADLGAEVIKVESPEGDLARHIPPHFIGDDSVYYMSVNRSKKSVAVDMKDPEGVAIVRRLALASDVVVENYRPGVIERLGLSPAELRRERPDLVWCSISGFGQDGPYRDKPAYDMIVQALSGGMSMTGEPGRPAVRAGIPIGDLAAGMYAAIAVLAALHRRTATGRGDSADISMLDCQAAMLCYQGAYYLHSGQVPGRQGSAHDSIPTYRTFLAGDGREVVITANTERMWGGLCRALGRPEWMEDPRFLTNRDRFANRHALWPLLDEAFRTRPADARVPILEREGIPVGVVNTLDRVMEDPQVRHRGMVQELVSGDGTAIRVMGNPLVFDEAVRDAPSFPPHLGRDSASVLREALGLPEGEIARLLELGIVSTAVPKAGAPAVGAVRGR